MTDEANPNVDTDELEQREEGQGTTLPTSEAELNTDTSGGDPEIVAPR